MNVRRGIPGVVLLAWLLLALAPAGYAVFTDEVHGLVNALRQRAAALVAARPAAPEDGVGAGDQWVHQPVL